MRRCEIFLYPLAYLAGSDLLRLIVLRNGCRVEQTGSDTATVVVDEEDEAGDQNMGIADEEDEAGDQSITCKRSTVQRICDVSTKNEQKARRFVPAGSQPLVDSGADCGGMRRRDHQSRPPQAMFVAKTNISGLRRLIWLRNAAERGV